MASLMKNIFYIGNPDVDGIARLIGENSPFF